MSPLEAHRLGYKIIVPNQRIAQYWGAKIIRQSGPQLSIPIQSYKSFVLSQADRQSWFTKARLLEDTHALIWLCAQRKNFSELSLNLAKIDYQALTRLARWQVLPEQGELYLPNPAQKKFITRARDIQKQKQSENILFLEDVAQKLIDEAPPTLGEKPLYWWGFDDPSPLQKAFFAICQKHNVQSTIETMPSIEPFVCIKNQYSSEKEEFEAALRWLQSCPPQERCAIVISDLQQGYTTLRYQAAQLCDPLLAALAVEQMSTQYSFSHGVPLSTVYPVCDLLDALLQLQPMSTPNLDASLWSKYCQQEMLVQRLDYWVKNLLRLLIEARWLESFTLSSQEYQAGEALWDTLVSLSELSGIIQPLTHQEFILALQSVCAITIFQPQSLNKNHMIIGLLEASALPWDRIWLLHADSSRFPQSLQKHPLLPDLLQEHFDFPHSSFARESRYLSSVLSRLFSHTPIRTLSFAQTLGHGHRAESSEIIEALAPGSYISALSPEAEPSQRVLFHNSSSPKDAGTLSLSQIESFRSCAFQGWAKTLPQSTPELRDPPLFDPRAYGIYWHTLVQNLLTHNQAPQPLPQQWTEEIAQKNYELLQTHAQGLERQFSQVLWECEKSISLTVGTFHIRGRIDLWDAQNNRVIDIKTRKTTISSWLKEEPTNWQGPLYALATNATTLGVLSLFEDKWLYQESPVQDLHAAWQKSLESLLQKWSQGQYAPQPQEEAACRVCALRPACRYHMIPAHTHEGVSS